MRGRDFVSRLAPTEGKPVQVLFVAATLPDVGAKSVKVMVFFLCFMFMFFMFLWYFLDDGKRMRI